MARHRLKPARGLYRVTGRAARTGAASSCLRALLAADSHQYVILCDHQTEEAAEACRSERASDRARAIELVRVRGCSALVRAAVEPAGR